MAATREARQNTARREIRLKKVRREQLEKFAEAHFMSRSEALRFVLQKVLNNEGPKEKPQRYTERVVFYDPENLLTRVMRRAERAGVPATDLVDQAIEEFLS